MKPDYGCLVQHETCRFLDYYNKGLCTDGLCHFTYCINITGKTNINTLRTGDADLRFYITTVQDG